MKARRVHSSRFGTGKVVVPVSEAVKLEDEIERLQDTVDRLKELVENRPRLDVPKKITGWAANFGFTQILIVKADTKQEAARILEHVSDMAIIEEHVQPVTLILGHDHEALAEVEEYDIEQDLPIDAYADWQADYMGW